MTVNLITSCLIRHKGKRSVAAYGEYAFLVCSILSIQYLHLRVLGCSEANSHTQLDPVLKSFAMRSLSMNGERNSGKIL